MFYGIDICKENIVRCFVNMRRENFKNVDNINWIN